jgi:hypothetical protein
VYQRGGHHFCPSEQSVLRAAVSDTTRLPSRTFRRQCPATTRATVCGLRAAPRCADVCAPAVFTGSPTPELFPNRATPWLCTHKAYPPGRPSTKLAVPFERQGTERGPDPIQRVVCDERKPVSYRRAAPGGIAPRPCCSLPCRSDGCAFNHDTRESVERHPSYRDDSPLLSVSDSTAGECRAPHRRTRPRDWPLREAHWDARQRNPAGTPVTVAEPPGSRILSAQEIFCQPGRAVGTVHTDSNVAKRRVHDVARVIRRRRAGRGVVRLTHHHGVERF